MHWITESSLPSETKTTICDKIEALIYDHCVVLQHNDSSTAARELPVTDDEQPITVTTPKSTPKRKSFLKY